MSYSWIPFYKELTSKLLDYTSNELLDFLNELRLGPILDQDINDKFYALADIDPFTFLSLLNKFGDTKRIELAGRVRSVMSLNAPSPADFDGVPTSSALKAWWFGYSHERKEDDIKQLRIFYRQVLEDDITEPQFCRVLDTHSVKQARLTEGLFYIHPEKYLPINSKTKPYLKTLGINYKFKTYSEYLKILNIVREKDNRPFWEISWLCFLNKINTPKSMTIPLNLILYGPPGTGKTYSTVDKAAEILGFVKGEESSGPSIREAQKKFFDQKQQEGRVGFVTFHQAMTYEDFVEGIKPFLNDGNEAGSGIRYHLEDGIFKRMARDAAGFKQAQAEARKSSLHLTKEQYDKANFFKMSLGNSSDVEDENIYQYCVDNNCLALGWGGEIDFTKASTENEIKQFFVQSGQIPNYGASAVKIFKFVMKQDDIVLISNGNRNIRAIGVIQGPYEFKPETEIRYKHFRPVKWLSKDLDIPVSKVLKDKNFSQQSIYACFKNDIIPDLFLKKHEEQSDATNNKFVLIIDEINRGNISQIFGELITLIEEDKRAGKNEKLNVTLPYSKKLFSVPSNLHIIGTMNTADRSVEALDTALRRRFSFEEIKPNYDLLDRSISGIHIGNLLNAINDRLEMLLDRDHQIGHAYLIDVGTEDQLVTVFNDKIVPLLQEFFFHTYSKIGLILGKAFLETANSVVSFAEFDDDIAAEYIDRPLYRLKPATIDSIRAILPK